MSESAATPQPRRNLARLRAQRQARTEGATRAGSSLEHEDEPAAPQSATRLSRDISSAIPLGGERILGTDMNIRPRGSEIAQENIKTSRASALNSISREDLDSTALSLSDAAQFMGFRFQDWADAPVVSQLHRFDPEVGKNGEKIVFVENAESGAFEAQEVGYANADSADEDDADEDSHLLGALDDSFPGEEGPLVGWGVTAGPGARDGTDGGLAENVYQTLSHGSVNMMIRCMYIFAQGILAGFSFVTVYNLSSFESDADFLENYQVGANEVRRFFYILCTVSLAGGLDACLDIFAPSSTNVMAIVEGPTGSDEPRGKGVSSGNRPNEEIKGYTNAASRSLSGIRTYGMGNDKSVGMILTSLMCAFYLICLIVSLVMAPQDVLIYQKNGEDGLQWASAALKDSNFKEGLDAWKSLATVRLVCALLAWVVVCLLMWSNLTIALNLIDLVVRLRQMVSRRKHRISLLEGEGDALADLPEAKLRHLVEVQRVGLLRAEEELRNRVGGGSL